MEDYDVFSDPEFKKDCERDQIEYEYNQRKREELEEAEAQYEDAMEEMYGEGCMYWKDQISLNQGEDMTEYKCNKCGHEWLPRTKNKPLVCPKCKTYNWEKKKEANNG